MIANGWRLYYFRLFKAALDELETTVTELARKDPKGYRTHPRTKLLASVYHAVTALVPANPDAPEFRLGKTLGSDNTNWRRVKAGTPDRYRLFFRFASSPMDRRGRSGLMHGRTAPAGPSHQAMRQPWHSVAQWCHGSSQWGHGCPAG
jgi:hypothetical protein